MYKVNENVESGTPPRKDYELTRCPKPAASAPNSDKSAAAPLPEEIALLSDEEIKRGKLIRTMETAIRQLEEGHEVKDIASKTACLVNLFSRPEKKEEEQLRAKVLKLTAHVNDVLTTGNGGNVYGLVSNVTEDFERLKMTFRDDGLPLIRKAKERKDKPLVTPSVLISGVLHKGSKMVLGGSSKSYKTWTLLDLGISVAAGVPWWGFPTVKTKTLYVNLEIDPSFFEWREDQVCQAKQIDVQDNFDIWSLRGFSCDADKLLPQILQTIQQDEYGLIIIDPIYKIYGDRDENAAGDIATLMNALENLSVKTGASVVFGAHYSKGNQSAKSAIDRVAGSGVFSRDPDAIVNLTAHKEDDCFTVDCILRNFKPVESFAVRWTYPLMVRDNNLDPKQLKQVTGTPEVFCLMDVYECLKGEMTCKEWNKAASDELGIGRSKFFDLKKELLEKGAVNQNPETKKFSKNQKQD